MDAVESRDPKAYQRLIEELELVRFCHLICHWILQVRCGLACELVSDQPSAGTCSPSSRSGRGRREAGRQPEGAHRFAKLALADDCRVSVGSSPGSG